MEERVTDVKKDTSNLDENTSDAEEGATLKRWKAPLAERRAHFIV